MQGDMMMPFIHSNERFRRVRSLVTAELRPTVSNWVLLRIRIPSNYAVGIYSIELLGSDGVF